jgi:hypothetical protein
MRNAIAAFTLSLLASAAFAQLTEGVERSSSPRGFQYNLFLDVNAADASASGAGHDKDANDAARAENGKRESAAGKRGHQPLVAQLAVSRK